MVPEPHNGLGASILMGLEPVRRIQPLHQTPRTGPDFHESFPSLSPLYAAPGEETGIRSPVDGGFDLVTKGLVTEVLADEFGQTP